MERKTHIAVVSAPAVSHQLAISELCKRLLQLHPNLHITFILPVINSLPNASKSIIAALSSLNNNIDIIVLPPVNLPQGTVLAVQIALAMSQSLPSILDALNSLTSTSSHPVALLADYFAYQVLPVAKKLNILSYIYFPSAPALLSLSLHASTLHETITCEFREMQEPILIPGCVPVHARDLPSSLQDRTSENYRHFLLRSEGLRLADGILVHGIEEMEAGALRAMKEESRGNPSVYLVGPIIQNLLESDTHKNGLECLTWLEEQAPRSVLYVSFGCGGTISQVQMNELAQGLELSCQKFVWVVREPSELPSSFYFGGSSGKDPLSFLPSGFLERTKGQGWVIPNWAPQAQIVSHKATAGFLTQCGWFSTLESVVHGLPIIAWPLFAEQRLTAAILTDGLKVALRPKANESGIVEKGEVANIIKSLMVGQEGIGIRERMKVLQDAAAAAMKEDGSSTVTLSQLVTEWKNFGARKEN